MGINETLAARKNRLDHLCVKIASIVDEINVDSDMRPGLKAEILPLALRLYEATRSALGAVNILTADERRMDESSST